MADYYGTQSATFRDARGFTTTVHGTIHSTVSAAALIPDASSWVTYLQGVSEAQLVRAGGLFIASYSAGYGSLAGYPDIAQKCRLFGYAASGNRTRFDIPAPLSNCFLADMVTADLATNAAMANLVGMAASATWVQNHTLLAFTINGGFFRDNKKRRRIVAGVLNPAGTGPA